MIVFVLPPAPNHPEVAAYLDSIFEFASESETGRRYAEYINRLKNADGAYRTTEAEILRDLYPPEDLPMIGEEAGLSLVRKACEELEERITARDPAPNPEARHRRPESSYRF